jgi:MoaA/NifB/PqqE/SkfB family radical SAM enzyme
MRNIDAFTTQELKCKIDAISTDKFIGFSGGEVTIRPDFLELVSYAKKPNNKIGLLSNVSTFHDNIFAQETSDYVDYIHISFHSLNENTFDKIVQRDGEYKKVVQGIQNIITAGIHCSAIIVITSLNISTLYDTVKFLRNISPNININLAAPHLEGNAWTNKYLMLKLSQLKNELSRVLNDFDNLITSSIPFCALPSNKYNVCEDRLNIKKEKTITPNSKNKSLDFIENNFGCKIKGAKCIECIMNNECTGVYKEYLKAYRDELDIFPIRGIKK